jgi:hypothetical protein
MRFIAQIEIPEEEGIATVLAYPPIFSDLEMMGYLLIGTTAGNMFFYNW